MIFKNIIIFEHDNLYYGSTNSKDKAILAICRYKNEEETFVSKKALHHDIKMQAEKGIF